MLLLSIFTFKLSLAPVTCTCRLCAFEELNEGKERLQKPTEEITQFKQRKAELEQNRSRSGRDLNDEELKKRLMMIEETETKIKEVEAAEEQRYNSGKPKLQNYKGKAKKWELSDENVEVFNILADICIPISKKQRQSKRQSEG